MATVRTFKEVLRDKQTGLRIVLDHSLTRPAPFGSGLLPRR